MSRDQEMSRMQTWTIQNKYRLTEPAFTSRRTRNDKCLKKRIASYQAMEGGRKAGDKNLFIPLYKHTQNKNTKKAK